MGEPLSLTGLTERARVLERYMGDGKVAADADALRRRIDAGYEKVAAAGLSADDPKLLKAQAAIAELEGRLARTEKSAIIPRYFEDVLLTIMRDALKWASVPKGSRVRVYLPDVYDITVKLDNLPEEPPF